MNFPYLRTTTDLKRDCFHCEHFLSLRRAHNDPLEPIDEGICEYIEGTVGAGLTCDMRSDRYAPRVEIKVNKE